MKKSKRLLLTLLLTLTLLLSTLSLAGCTLLPATDYSKEELQSFMDAEGGASCDSVGDYLKQWKFPRFQYYKLYMMHYYVDVCYYKDVEDMRALAYDVASLYLEHFYDETDRTDREANTDAYLMCYAEALGDPYAVYRTAAEYEDYDVDMSGSFVGIGVSVVFDPIANEIEVVEVIHDSPAQAAGILPGDLIVGVGDLNISASEYLTIVNAIRGEEGTEVTVRIDRAGEPLSFTMVRRALTDRTVSYEILEGDIAYVRITQFKDNTDEQFCEAIDACESAGVRGYIFDVRANPGGYLHTVVSSIAYLSRKGETIATFDNGSSPMLDEDDHEVDKPMVVLANGYTASAGELFTAALRDLKGAAVIGETTFGKGIMQGTYSLGDGSTITMTIAHYNPPSGINFHGVGVVPDVSVAVGEEGDAQYDAALSYLFNLVK